MRPRSALQAVGGRVGRAGGRGCGDGGRRCLRKARSGTALPTTLLHHHDPKRARDTRTKRPCTYAEAGVRAACTAWFQRGRALGKETRGIRHDNTPCPSHAAVYCPLSRSAATLSIHVSSIVYAFLRRGRIQLPSQYAHMAAAVVCLLIHTDTNSHPHLVVALQSSKWRGGEGIPSPAPSGEFPTPPSVRRARNDVIFMQTNTWSCLSAFPLKMIHQSFSYLNIECIQLAESSRCGSSAAGLRRRHLCTENSLALSLPPDTTHAHFATLQRKKSVADTV